MHNPFVKPKPNPKRDRPRRTGDRVILRGPAKTQRRREIFERSGGFCEAIKKKHIPIGAVAEIIADLRCNAPITWETMQWSHPDHGPYKDDRYGIASCAECHQVGVHNPKACPRKPGRRMNQTEAVAYWKSTECFCGKETKASGYSFGSECWAKLSPQSQYDLLNTLGEDYIQAIALAEIEVLSWKPAEEKECSPTIAETK